MKRDYWQDKKEGTTYKKKLDDVSNVLLGECFNLDEKYQSVTADWRGRLSELFWNNELNATEWYWWAGSLDENCLKSYFVLLNKWLDKIIDDLIIALKIIKVEAESLA